MSKKRWFRFYIDRWRNGTFGMSPNEIAAYIEVLCELYDHDGFAVLNVPVMARRCGMRPTSFKKALDHLVSTGKINIEGGFFTAKSVTEEIKSREKLGEKSVKSRDKLAEKANVFNGNGQKVTPYTEYRTKNLTNRAGLSALRPPDFTNEKVEPTDALLLSLERRKH